MLYANLRTDDKQNGSDAGLDSVIGFFLVFFVAIAVVSGPVMVADGRIVCGNVK